MKSPSRSIAKSLRRQSPGGQSPSLPKVGNVKRGGPTMSTPGEGTVQRAPGYTGNSNFERSAARYADALETARKK